MTNYILSKFRSKVPLLTSGKSDSPIISDHITLTNLEQSAKDILGGIEICPSKDGYAIFGNPNLKGSVYSAIEIHQDNRELYPFEMINNEGVLTLAPAIYSIVQKGLFEMMIVSTAHPPVIESLVENFDGQKKNANNPYEKNLLTIMELEELPRRNEVIRNLFFIGKHTYIIPSSSGQVRGLGGSVVKFSQAGPVLYSLIHRKGPNFKEIYPSMDKGVDENFHLNFAAPRKLIEYDEILEIDGIPFAYFVGGIVDSETYQKLSLMDIDMFIKLDFIAGTSVIYSTTLLRTSGSTQKIKNIYEDLKYLGGWHQIRRHGLAKAFKYTIPGYKHLPIWYTRYQVKNWFNTSNNGSSVGLLHRMSDRLAPVGDPKGDMSFGKIAGHSWLYNSQELASVIITGSSNKTGKSLAMMRCGIGKNKYNFGVDVQASNLESYPSVADKSDGTVKLIRFEDPKFSSNDTEEHKKHTWDIINNENNKIVKLWLEELYLKSKIKGEYVGLPFILHPIINSIRYINLVKNFFEELYGYTKLWQKNGFVYPQLMVNDFSHLLSLMNVYNTWENGLAYDTANIIEWYISMGRHNGISTSWFTTHSKFDFESILKRPVYSKFSLHLDGGLKEYPDYHYDLIIPSSEITVVKGLDLRVYNPQLLKEFQRITPEESTHLIKRREITNDDIPRLLAEAEGWDGRS